MLLEKFTKRSWCSCASLAYFPKLASSSLQDESGTVGAVRARIESRESRRSWWERWQSAW